MRGLLLLLFFLVLAVAAFFVLRPTGEAAFGPAVALCPGPDHYGYTCESGAAFSYVDAGEDRQLYEDDGFVRLDLPFPFTFYGTTYTALWASSNGNLQFARPGPDFENECLEGGPVAAMGDMIAPYWDDLDLRLQGYLETETLGEEPQRVFVVEWEAVPPFGGDPQESVTFEVQLFEESNDIVFLYPDVTTEPGNHGSSATVGLQSAAQQLALQYSCNQSVIVDASTLHFPHPANPNEEVGLENQASLPRPRAQVLAKGDVGLLLQRLNARGRAALPRLRTHWLSQTPPRLMTWRWSDVIGEGREALIVLWRGTTQHPHAAEVAVLSPDESGEMQLRFSRLLSTRSETLAQPAFFAAEDVTGDGVADIVLDDAVNGRVAILTAADGALQLHHLSQRCAGALALRDGNGDGAVDVLRGDCESAPRTITIWDGHRFVARQR